MANSGFRSERPAPGTTGGRRGGPSSVPGVVQSGFAVAPWGLACLA